MWENYKATILQNFYRRYLKCERDQNVPCKIRIISQKKKKLIEIASPLCPLYRTAYDEKYRFRLVEWHSNQKKACVWHFNILNLLDWLNISREWTNPMTNCLFLNSSIDKILDFIKKKNIKKKLKLPIKYNLKETVLKIVKSKYEEGTIYMDLLVKSVLQSKDDEVFNLLNNNYDKIESDYFKIDGDIDYELNIEGETINPLGILHLAISKNQKNICHHLMYYGCNLEKTIGKNKYTPLHLAAIYNLPEIGHLLKIYGANIYAECILDNNPATIFDICDKMGHNNFIMKILS